MPGILPMKVIKVGTSAQTRIAQACDRCRSKKIRCDGFRPTCTQCANVGFECKTSDKLSRRAFPRGYTESLEERVRALETEVRELKDLLDEKDEKIDMLSKMHSYSPRSMSSRRPSSIHSIQEKGQIQASVDQEKDIRFKLQQSPYLIHGDNTDLYFVGNSSSRAFIIAFRRKLQESGKGNCDFNVDAFFTPSPKPSLPTLLPSNDSAFWAPPSRMHSDQMVNIFFQEWAPLFPVLHRLSFLTLYEQYVANASNVQDKKSLAQLNLVFGIASLSSESRVIHSADLCERQWMTALESFIKETSLVTLQCLILAQIYFIQKGEPEKVLQYKGFAIAISHRLGLHLSQKRFALGVLTIETRKKVFWSLYAVDCFSAAMLGLPKMLNEEDIFCEYPQDADDEYVTEKGFQPSLPGEATKLSSALAMFRGCRILAKVLNQNYPAASSHELSLNNIAALSDELEEWSNGLPSHLKLTFVQDKPSANTISSRSPLLSLTYNFIRTLLHRPVVSANLGDRASSSIVALAGAHKQIVQIIQLLDERNLCFSHCLNKNEILLTSGIGLLFQSLELDRDGKMMKDSQRLICQVINLLDTRNAPGSAEFKHLGCSMLSLPTMAPPPSNGPMKSASKRSGSAMTPASSASTDRNDSHQHIAQLAASYSSYTTSQQLHKEKVPKELRKSVSTHPESLGQQTIRRLGDKSLRPLAPSLPSHSPCHTSLSTPATDLARSTAVQFKQSQSPATGTARPNLDYFSFSEAPVTTRRPSPAPAAGNHAQWQSMLEELDPETLHNSNSRYEWPPMDTLISPTTVEDATVVVQSASPKPDEWSPELWFNDDTPHISQSVLSFSDESLTSGEEFSSVEYGSTRSDSGFRTINVAQVPDVYTPEAFGEMDDLRLEIGA